MTTTKTKDKAVKEKVVKAKPKSKSHQNRGLKFEALIQKKCEELKDQGLALINKVPTAWQVLRIGARIVNAFPIAESKFVDFIGMYKGLGIAIEAKETKNKTSFPFANIKESQIEFLEQWENLGGRGYYIIRFESNKTVFLVKAKQMKDWMDNIGRKSAPYNLFIETQDVIQLDYKELNFIDYIK